ncbi:MAG: hypothetical protein EZS28_032492, partial [Streblomastix strix]
RNETYTYLLANNATQQFKPTHYYITYDFETVERKVNIYFGKPLNNNDPTIRNSQQISVLEPLSVASTIKFKWREQYQNDDRYKKIVTPFGYAALKTIFYDLRQGADFITQWIEQVFEEAKQVSLDNKYDNQDIPYNQNVSIIGFNSSRFDQALFSKYLHNDKWAIQSYIGTMGQGKQIVVVHRQNKQLINFIDAMNYTQSTDLANFAKDFGNKDNESKGIFPYEGITYDNYNYEFNKSQPFPIRAFDSQLKNKTMNDDDYLLHLSDAKNYATRWDYLQHYNELDSQILIQPLDNLINWFYQYNLDMFSFMSLAAIANAIKYAIAYKDFDLNVNYPQQTSKSKPFILYQNYWNSKVIGYNIQDKQKHRKTNNNVTINDYEYYKDLFDTSNSNPVVNTKSVCVICGDKFTKDNKPSLDRIDNKLPHTKSNCQPSCLYCNKYKSDKDEKITQLFIQLRRYCSINHLPQTIVNNEVYQLIRRNITSGLSNVRHRYNHANETTIKRYYYNETNKTITVIDANHTVTHICGVDFNSLYPNCFSSQYHPFNKYTNGIMYMCGSVTSVINDPIYSKKIINSAYRFTDLGQLFIAQLKGHIDENYINDFINFPPIFHNLSYQSSKSVIGEYIYDQMQQAGVKTDKQERKLTQLLSTHNQYMTFSSYYLWFLIDDCHFIIDDIKQLVTFDKYTKFNAFVNEFMNKRIEAIKDKNNGLDKFCKMILNASYGSDGMNTEKYNKIKLLTKDKTIEAHTKQSWMNDRKLADNLYAVQFNPCNCRCNACLQVAYFTLDNAKYCYLNFIYNFMYKCLDMTKLHFIEGDTDSAYWAISGKQVILNDKPQIQAPHTNQQQYEDNLHQGFKYVIKDQQFYDTNAKYFFSTIVGDKQDEKKLLVD